MTAGFVYAIGDGVGPVKIGWSSNPYRRLAKIKTDCPAKVKLLGVTPATEAQEAEVHARLAAWRVNREWFRHEGPVSDFIATLSAPNRRAGQVRGPMEHIRRNVFGTSQADFAAIAAVTQATVSRWENGGEPHLLEMRRIRAEARARGLAWDDRWFFEAPATAPSDPPREKVAS